MSDPWKADLPIREDNIINESERSVDPTDDEYKLVKLEGDGKISEYFTTTKVLDILRTAKSNASLNGTENILTVNLPANFFDDNVYIECEIVFSTLQRATSGASANGAINAKLNGNNLVTSTVQLQNDGVINHGKIFIKKEGSGQRATAYLFHAPNNSAANNTTTATGSEDNTAAMELKIDFIGTFIGGNANYKVDFAIIKAVRVTTT